MNAKKVAELLLMCIYPLGLASVCKIISEEIAMFRRIKAISEILSALKGNSITILSFLNKVLRMSGLAILTSSVAACSGVPLVPGI